MTRLLLYIGTCVVLTLCFGCSATKGLSPHETLYTGTEIDVKGKATGKHVDRMKREIQAGLPKPNNPGFLNIRTWLYNMYDSAGTQGYRHIIKNRMGSKPQIYKQTMLEYAENTIKKQFLDFGYFDARVECDSISKKRKTSILCQVNPYTRYKIDNVYFPYDSLDISRDIGSVSDVQYIKEGRYYGREDIINERRRLLRTGNNIGYSFLSQEDIVFHIDTLGKKQQADVYIVMKPNEDSLHYQKYTTGKIYINSDYKIGDKDTIQNVELDEKSGFHNFNTEAILNTDAIKKVILMKTGEPLNNSLQKLTANRLLEMGLFRFVNIKMDRRGDTLDQYIYLTRGNIKSITGEFEVNNRSGNIFGTAGNVRYTHRNLFRGGEMFNVGLKAGLETQLGVKSLINSSYVSAEASIQFPRLVLPFMEARTTKYFVPKTIMSINTNYQRRTNYYDVFSQQAKYGFLWKESKNKVHEFNPIDLSYNRLINPSKVFLDSLSRNPRLAKSFQNMIIPTSNYSFTYENSSDVGRDNSFYEKATIEFAGHTYRLIDKYLVKSTDGTIFKTPYSQYTKITSDTRKYWKYGSLSLATRLYAGAIFAYGNSTQPPFNRQFSIGGANSLRAFSLRSLGPGVFYLDRSDDEELYWDQIGDVKLEINAELRFPVFNFIKGAIFVDSGNIWLLDTKDPDLDFSFSDFYKEIAVGTGFGLRFDLNFFVFRTDLAFPLRKPLSTGSFGWTMDESGFMTLPWLQKNVKLNLGIGYPF